MKKVYAFAAAGMLAVTATAAPANMKVNKSIADQRVATSEKLCALPGTENSSAKKVATRADEWTALGEGAFREFIFSSIYRGIDPYELPVEIEQNSANPSSYRLVNLYRDFVTDFWGGQGYIYDATATNYIYIDTYKLENGKTVCYVPEEASLGFYVDESLTGITGGTAILNSNLANLIANYGAETVYQAFPDFFGAFENGVFSFPAQFYNEDAGRFFPTLFMSTTGMEAGYGMSINSKGQFSVALPGMELPAPPDPFGSYNFVGECEMQNNFIENFFEDWTSSTTGKVEVYEEPNAKGYFHIKNAYLAGGWNNPDEAAEIDLEIDLTNPNYGMLPEQSTGYYDDVDDLGLVEVMSASIALVSYVEPSSALTEAEFAKQYPDKLIKLDTANKRIVIPAGAMMYFFPDLPANHPYYNNLLYAPEGGKESWIQLPADYDFSNSGVNEIATDNANAPVRYFNLQGVEVANPEAGQIVIKKQGSKVVKVVAE